LLTEMWTLGRSTGADVPPPVWLQASTRRVENDMHLLNAAEADNSTSSCQPRPRCSAIGHVSGVASPSPTELQRTRLHCMYVWVCMFCVLRVFVAFARSTRVPGSVNPIVSLIGAFLCASPRGRTFVACATFAYERSTCVRSCVRTTNYGLHPPRHDTNIRSTCRCRRCTVRSMMWSEECPQPNGILSVFVCCPSTRTCTYVRTEAPYRHGRELL
jgi:hypothetical protein